MNIIDNKIDKSVKNLRSELYIWYGGLLAMSIVCYSLSTAITKVDSETAISLQSFLLLILLTGLPGTFIVFKNKMRKNCENPDLEKRIERYETYSRIRQFIFFVFGFMVLAAHVFTVMKGSIMLLFAVLVLTIFIFPSRMRLMMECGMLPQADSNETEPTTREAAMESEETEPEDNTENSEK